MLAFVGDQLKRRHLQQSCVLQAAAVVAALTAALWLLIAGKNKGSHFFDSHSCRAEKERPHAPQTNRVTLHHAAVSQLGGEVAAGAPAAAAAPASREARQPFRVKLQREPQGRQQAAAQAVRCGNLQSLEQPLRVELQSGSRAGEAAVGGKQGTAGSSSLILHPPKKTSTLCAPPHDQHRDQ